MFVLFLGQKTGYKDICNGCEAVVCARQSFKYCVNCVKYWDNIRFGTFSENYLNLKINFNIFSFYPYKQGSRKQGLIRQLFSLF